MKRIIIVISVFTYLFSSCEKQKIDIDKNEIDYFPNTIDSYWKYERYDSLTNTLDTLTVSITADSLISDNNYKIWEYKYNDRLEKMYVLQSNDSIKIYKTPLEQIDQLYIVPFDMGKGWINPDYKVDTSYISKITSILIDENTYQDVALIERNAYCCNDYLTEKIWIKPQIGILKLEIKHLILGPYKNETWRLIEKDIK